ncbi:MAG: hypothetical protein C4297_08575 [Gemmataceae bacterium]
MQKRFKKVERATCADLEDAHGGPQKVLPAEGARVAGQGLRQGQDADEVEMTKEEAARCAFSHLLTRPLHCLAASVGEPLRWRDRGAHSPSQKLARLLD